MSQNPTLCYFIQETKDSPVYLCVRDFAEGGFYRFPVSVSNISRLASEGCAIVHSAITGYSEKHAFQEVAAVLSKKFGEP
jgi:hypothetical protein